MSETALKIWNIIAKSKDLIMIIIPRIVWRQLQSMGVQHGNVIVWDSIEDRGQEVVVTLRILKNMVMSRRAAAEAASKPEKQEEKG